MTQYTSEAIKELLSKVTPGKWIHRNAGIRVNRHDHEYKIIECLVPSPDLEGLPFNDAEFIAQSKEIIQWLFEKLEKHKLKANKMCFDLNVETMELQEKIKDLELRFQAAKNRLIHTTSLDDSGYPKAMSKTRLEMVDQEIESEYVRLKAEQLKKKDVL